MQKRPMSALEERSDLSWCSDTDWGQT